MYKKALEKFGTHKNWYRDTFEHIQKHFDDPELFAGLLSATSPRASVRRSWNTSLRIYARFKTGKSIDYTGMMPIIRNNVDRVLQGEPLSGLKVSAFYQNLIGNYGPVTIDVWMLKFFHAENIWMTPNRYKKLSDRITEYARKIGLYPAELQAICWTYARSRNNRSDVSYMIIANENQLSLF